MIWRFKTAEELLTFKPKITSEIIQAGTKRISEWIIADLSQKEDEALMVSSAGLKDVLKNIVLEVDPASYEKWKPDIEAILKKRAKKYKQSVISFCDEIVQLLHISDNGTHPLKERIMQDFKSRLAFQFSFWNHTKDPLELEQKYAEKIPWNVVFQNISEEIRVYIVSIIDRYEAKETKLVDGSNRKDEMKQYFQRRAQSLVSLKNKIQSDQENSDLTGL